MHNADAGVHHAIPVLTLVAAAAASRADVRATAAREIESESDSLYFAGRPAPALAPQDLNARYWLAAAAGRRARQDDALYSARLAVEVYEQTSAILAADSMHAGAHHALGMLHAEVTRAPKLVRFVAGRVLRIDVAKRASVREAERHLRRAVELDPTMILYAVDLAEFYHRRGSEDEATALVSRLRTLRPRHPIDALILTTTNSRFATR